MRVIGVVGKPGSGKTEAANVAEEMDIPVVRMGDVIRQEVKERGLEPTDENMGQVATEVRDSEGMDAFAEKCIDEIKSKSNEVVFIDGIRGWSEARRFRQEFGDGFILIGINSSFEERFKRISSRGRSDDFSSREELRRRDERETGYGLDEALDRAQRIIDNEGSLDQFRKNVRSVLNEIINENV